MFLSGCLVRSAHALLTFITTIVLFLHNTDLRRCRERGDLLQPLLFGAVVLLSVLLYFTVSLMDPGFVLSDSITTGPSVDRDEERDEEREKMVPPARRCGFCFLLQPMRARHCRSCRRCVRRFDHHCPWIHNCVGERNHRWFLLYLCVQLTAACWALLTAWSGLVSAAAWQQWLSQNGLLLGALGVTALASAVLPLLLCIHLYLASANTTTWEFMSRHRIAYLKHRHSEENPFDRGLVCNLWLFFCACGTVAWDRIYSGHVNEQELL